MSLREAFDNFTDAVSARRAAARDAAAELAERAQAVADPATAAMIEEATQLVRRTVRDLGVAEEELVVQNEALFDARTEMAEAGLRYKQLFDLAPASYLVTDRFGKILDANRAATALLNRPVNYLVGKPLPVFVASGERGAFRAALTRAAASYMVEEWPVALVAGAEPLEVTVAVRAVRDAVGQVQSLYWLLRDERGRPDADLL